MLVCSLKSKRSSVSLTLTLLLYELFNIGKTSFLRRYFTGKFEPEYRKSTIGADFYSTIIKNPWFGTNDKVDICTNTSCIDNVIEESAEISNLYLKSKISKRKDVKKAKKKKAKKNKDKHKSKESSSRKRSTEPSTSLNSDTAITTESSIHTNATENSRQSSMLMPSIPSHIPQTQQNYLIQSPQISIQMWDTAGKERLLSESTGMITSRLGDSFFRHAHAAVLIYDATSSRSFLQLMKWYSDLLDRIKKVQCNGNDVCHDENDLSHRGNEKDVIPKQKFPVLIVGTKLDRVKAELSKQTRKKIVPQRNVLGLKNKTFKGQEYHYEYTVRGPTDHKASNNHQQVISNVFTGDVPLSYGLEGGTWTSDHEYQDCLRVVEDGCFPDRYMVLLWCKRNGLQHVEVSALDGTGRYNIAQCFLCRKQ